MNNVLDFSSLKQKKKDSEPNVNWLLLKLIEYEDTDFGVECFVENSKMPPETKERLIKTLLYIIKEDLETNTELGKIFKEVFDYIK